MSFQSNDLFEKKGISPTDRSGGMQHDELFKELARAHRSATRFAQSLLPDHDPNLADDVVQDAAEIVVRKIISGEYKPARAAVQPFFIGVIKTKVQELSSRTKWRRIGLSDADLIDPQSGPAEPIERQEVMRQLKDRFVSLSVEHQAALNRHFGAALFGLQLPPGIEDGVKPSTWYVRKFRAIESLREEFGGEMV